MASEQLAYPRIALKSGQSLIGMFVDDDSDMVQRFTEDDFPNAGELSEGARDALSVIGAWSDMDWEDLADSLDRIRHESQPTPPIEL